MTCSGRVVFTGCPAPVVNKSKCASQRCFHAALILTGATMLLGCNFALLSFVQQQIALHRELDSFDAFIDGMSLEEHILAVKEGALRTATIHQDYDEEGTVRSVGGSPTYDLDVRDTKAELNSSVDEQPQERQIFTVFSTGCTPFQDWQAYLFFYQAMIVKQPGHVIRLVSGCKQAQKAALLGFHNDYIATMSERFHIHFTPYFGRKKDFFTKYWNKPFGLKHWMERELGYDEQLSIEENAHNNDIVILLDPDMVLLKPLGSDFSGKNVTRWVSPGNKVRRASAGQAVAQQYKYGADWLTLVQDRLSEIVGEESPVHRLVNSPQEAADDYACGPPYILTAKDMYRVSVHWSRFVPVIFDIVDDFMAEMYGYSMAAAHLMLPHHIARDLMMSNRVSDGGWNKYEEDPTLVPETACGVLAEEPSALASTEPRDAAHRPYVLHYCQHYAFGDFGFLKYSLPKDIFTNCSAPLLAEPPQDAFIAYDFSKYTDGRLEVYDKSKPAQVQLMRREAYMVCTLIPMVNRAARSLKFRRCRPGKMNIELTHFIETQER